MSFLGMSPQDVSAHEQRLTERAGQLEQLLATLEQTVRGGAAQWVGPDADRFRDDWTARGAQPLQSATASMQELAALLRQEITAQDDASGPDGDGGMPPGPGADPGDEPRGRAELPDGETAIIDGEVWVAWEAMSDKERLKVAAALVNAELAKYGLPPVSVLTGDMDPLLGEWREHHQGLDFIMIDEDHLESPQALNTLLHEARHAIQNGLIERTDITLWDRITGDDNAADYAEIEREHGITREEIEAWRENDKNYIQPPKDPPKNATLEERRQFEEDYERYRQQVLERDAHEAGIAGAESMTIEQLRSLQQAAGVEPTG